jgi:ribulose bisphosphate carboxylase small subunit
MTEDVFWKNFEGIAKASYSFKCEELLRQLEKNEENGINVVGLHIDYAARTVEFIVKVPPEEAERVLKDGVKIDEDDDFELIDITR